LSERNAEFRSEQHRQTIRRRVQRGDAVGFFNLLTGPELLNVTESQLPEHRERLYPPTVTLSMFMRQTLDADGSCQKAGQQLGGATPCGRPERAERSHRRILQSAGALARIDGDRLDARRR
jgi:hypothetical protein